MSSLSCCCPCLPGLTAVASVEIDAPVQVVWDVISDLEASPSILSVVESVELMSETTLFEVGTKWRETRRFQNEEFILNKTITQLQIDSNRRSVHINVNFSEIDDAQMQNVINTSTLTVEDTGDNNTTCILIGSFAIATSNILFKLIGSFQIKSARRSFQTELEEYEAEALKRVRQQEEEEEND